MNLARIAAVAAFAVLPMTAGAVTITDNNINLNETVDISGVPFKFNAGFEDEDTAGTYNFTFVNDTFEVAALSLAITTINQFSDGLGGLQDYYFTGGVTTTFGDDTHFTPEGVVDGFQLSTLIPVGESRTLSFAFGDPVATADVGPDIDFRVVAAPIPVPAALPLLLGALGGLAFLGRRRIH